MTRLKLTTYDAPIARAGIGNAVLLMLPIAMIVLWQILSLNSGGPKYVQVLAAAYMALVMWLVINGYRSLLTEVDFNEVDVEFVFPLHRSRIRYDDIAEISIRYATLSPMLTMKISSRSKSNNVSARLAGYGTPWGTVRQTGDRIEAELRSHIGATRE